MAVIRRPAPSEYAPHYAQYIERVPEGDLAAQLEAQIQDLEHLLADLPESSGAFRYAEGKWSVKELLGHLTDTERIMAYRLLRIARGDQTPLAGFDQDDYVRNGHADARPLRELAAEFTAVRRATLALVRSLDDPSWTRLGSAGGKPVSTAALAHVMAGHVSHHLEILTARYLQ